MDIQWFPGHMAKAMRHMKEGLSLVDIVVEVLDARIPIASRNPELIAIEKPKIIALNKSDLANEKTNHKWRIFYEGLGFGVVLTNSVGGVGLKDIETKAKEMLKEKIERNRQRGRINTPVRAMIVGIPNSGKSTMINSFAKKKIAKVENRPGVTRAKQWIKISKDFELLDTPGILWHKFDDKEIGINLALTGAIKDNVLDTITLSRILIEKLLQIDENIIKSRYKLESLALEPTEIIESIAKKRGFILQKGEVDINKAANILIDEFRSGALGRISLEN